MALSVDKIFYFSKLLKWTTHELKFMSLKKFLSWILNASSRITFPI
jgi:endo-1,4-beta-D-glucanase Y